ncbi:MAG: hypothetical protein APR53_10930 [Methanoculleus sp. SDB]|nr:MAG: hypothetical protein APR53_10930 [Methanoculleus sp. SDB]
MKSLAICTFAVLLLALVPGAAAVDVTMYEWDLNVDGVLYSAGGSGYPAGVDLTGFDPSTGLGVIAVRVNKPGTHTVLGFFDAEIDEVINTYFNEFGDTHGSPAPGQVWEIDEPGYVYGNIHDNFIGMTLDNTNGVPASFPDDVSMATGWHQFTLGDGQAATILFSLSMTPPSSGFYLLHTDPESSATIYLQSSLAIEPVSVPEFPTLALPLITLIGLLFTVGAVQRMK